MIKENESLGVIDIVVIGCGGAGCAAAIEASRFTKSLLVLTKSVIGDNKTNRAQGGIQAVISPNDSKESHFQDTYKGGNFKGKKELIRILVEGGPDTIVWLSNIGVQFDKEDSGEYKLIGAAGLSHNRVLSCKDSTGNGIMRPLLTKLSELNIAIIEKTGVTSITKNRHFVITTQSENETYEIKAKIIILATGGLMPKDRSAGLSLGKVEKSPDGVTLAQHLGAKVGEIELIQYHPTGVIWPPELRRMRLPEPMRAYGAKFLDKNGREFVDPLIMRNKLKDIIVNTCNDGLGVTTSDGYRGVWLTLPDIDKQHGKGYTEENFPKFYNSFMKYGIDISKQNVLVYPIVHYNLGGVCIDENGETTVRNLFAAGETTYGIHGEDRLMGNSLLDIFVFGRIVGKSAGERLTLLDE